MDEQQNMPPALHRLRFYVRKHHATPGYYTTLGEMVGEPSSALPPPTPITSA